ncbi:MAG: sigma-70 family RNA polymerase sigma factor [Acidobacteria bacterium]|nr:sigma-70 family RNA polymerase sigma factor [Acidobacteriota bacterium]
MASRDPRDLESTVQLLARAREGDPGALDALFSRYIPLLQRWARDRLPRGARDGADTHDLVQDAVFQTFKRIEAFEPRTQGALHAYLRQSVMNRVRDHIRRAGRRPQGNPLDEDQPDPGPSPLEEAIGADALERYERALEALSDADRELVIASVEMGCSYQELAEMTGRATPDAARKAARRALVRLAEEMRREH